MLNEKVTKVFLTIGLKKKIEYKWVNIFQKLQYSGRRVKIELDLINYATNSDLKKCSRCWYIKIF